MSSPDPERLKAVFDEAFELSDGHRGGYLDAACAGDPLLRERVDQLLQAYDEAGSRLDRLPVTELVSESPDIQMGSHIGSYRVLKQVGEGGFGYVFLAEQTRPMKRQVALKVLKPGMDSREVIGRFEAERQALAMMNHTNIASIFDGGTTPEGRPYFVMEYVDGDTLVDYSIQSGLSIPQRLDLFVDVCRGIEHAHQKGVIHRDMKPSNVLVAVRDGHAVPKVIDFGVAKAISVSHMRTGFTRSSQMVGTPTYMSPEQAAVGAGDIDTRSDIYSLGVLLYELLTGTTPHDSNVLESAAHDEMRRIIREEEPPTPSKRLSENDQNLKVAASKKHVRFANVARMRDELDWIVMKAIRKDRSSRYQTASELADDVQRFLRGETVTARPPSTAYRLKKFVRKYRTVCLFSVLLFSILVASSIVSGYSAILAQRARKAESEKRRQAQAVTDFLIEAFKSPAPYLDGRSVKVADVLDRAVDQLEEGFSDDPNTKTHLLTVLATTYFNLNMIDKYVELAEKCVELNGFHDRLDMETPPKYMLATAYYAAGRHHEAAEILEEILPVYRAQLGLNDQLTLWTEGAHAVCLQAMGRHHEALSILERIYRIVDDPVDYRTARSLAVAYQKANRHSDAITVLKRSVEAAKQLPENEREFSVIMNLALLGYSYCETGRVEEGTKLQEESLARSRRILGEENNETLTIMNNLARAYSIAKKYQEAVELTRQVLDVRQRKLGATDPRTLLTRKALADRIWHSGKLKEAESLWQEMLPTFDQELGAAHPWTIRIRKGLAFCAFRVDHAKGIELMNRVAEAENTTFGSDHFRTLRARRAVAIMLSQSGKHNEAIERLKTLVEVSGKCTDPAFGASMKASLAAAYVRSRQLDQAIDVWQSSVDDGKGSYYATTRGDFLLALLNTAKQLIEDRDYRQAEEFSRHAVRIREQVEGKSCLLFDTYGVLGQAIAGQCCDPTSENTTERFHEAESLLLTSYEGLAHLDSLSDGKNNLLLESLQRVVDFYETWDRQDAAVWTDRLQRLRVRSGDD